MGIILGISNLEIKVTLEYDFKFLVAGHMFICLKNS